MSRKFNRLHTLRQLSKAGLMAHRTIKSQLFGEKKQFVAQKFGEVQWAALE
jgi:hypothetical protein